MKVEESVTNHITSTILNSEVANGIMPTPEEFLSMCADIICQLDSDIAIKVMDKLTERFGEAAQKQALSIKVNFGY